MMRKIDNKQMLARAALLLLFFAVAGLSILSMHTRYLHKSNPIRFISKATKMNVPHHSAVQPAGPLYPAAELVPPEPEFRTVLAVQPEKLRLQQIGLILSLQYRSPPSLLA